jgi:hypothetical protein
MAFTCGSTSQPWYRLMFKRSNMMHSGVYSKSLTPAKKKQKYFLSFFKYLQYCTEKIMVMQK